MLALTIQQSYTPQASFHYDSDDSDDDEHFQLPAMRRPELQRRCANQTVKFSGNNGKNSSTTAAATIHNNTLLSVPRVAPSAKPSLQVPQQYNRYPYLNYARVVAHGYLDDIQDALHADIPDDVSKLVLRYAINREDGFFQLTHYLSTMLSKVKQPFISMKIVHALIGHFFNKTAAQKLKPQQIEDYYCKLQAMQYIVVVKLAKDIVYVGVFNGTTMNYYSVAKR